MILRIDISSMAGVASAYSLTASGFETRGDRSGPISIAAFLEQFGPSLQRLVAQRTRGWDQVRVHYEASCQPIYNISIQLPDGRGARTFGMYGFPRRGSVLEDTQIPVDPDLVDLFAYCLGREQ